MKKRELLLDYLKKQPSHSFVTGEELAKILGVTDRSIRYYVKQLNEAFNAIETSRKGYRYNHHSVVSSEIVEDETVEGRRFSILRHLIRSGASGIDLFDEAEAHWVSEATISADMTALQTLTQNYHLKIRQHDFRYILTGDENQKRALIMDLICNPQNPSPSLEAEMQKFLGHISLSVLKEQCQKIFDAYHFSSNNYFFQNFMLHLVIALSQRETAEKTFFSSPSLPMIEAISNGIFDAYDLELANEDKYELALLCDAERGQVVIDVSDYVNPIISKSLKKALAELSTVFLIDFTDQVFLTRLLLHTQNLYHRVKANKVKRNLSAVEIKTSYPALFDVAVYLSSLIARDLKIEIVEDEIAFLTLHIGSFLDQKKKNDNKIRVLLSAPSYLDRQAKLQTMIEEKFGEELLFVANPDDVELFISVGQAPIQDVATVKIHDFLTERDFDLIYQGIERIKQQRYLAFLETLLPRLLQKDAQIELANTVSKLELFQEIGAWFTANGYTRETYTDELLEREKMASTTFASGIAIPHTIKYEAEKTGLLVIRPSNVLAHFSWEGQDVALVIALAVSQSDSRDFNRIFPRMIECLTDRYHVQSLRGSQTQLEFIQRLIELMTADGYYEM